MNSSLPYEDRALSIWYTAESAGSPGIPRAWEVGSKTSLGSREEKAYTRAIGKQGGNRPSVITAENRR